jgi:hypothetical protein
MKFSNVLAFAGLMFAATQVSVSAAILTEDFEAPFPAWETGWLGTNSNLQNFYGVGFDRGNNPDGLWVGNQDTVFNPSFGATLTSLAVDVAGYSTGTRLQIFDMSGSVLLDQLVSLTFGAGTDPGTYSNYSVSSLNGISKFSFIGGSPVGNTSIDNVVVSTATGAQAVPEPFTIIGTFVGGTAAVRMRKKLKNANKA